MELLEKSDKFKKDVEVLRMCLCARMNDNAICEMSDDEFRLARAALNLIKSTTELVVHQTIAMDRIESKLDRLIESSK